MTQPGTSQKTIDAIEAWPGADALSTDATTNAAIDVRGMTKWFFGAQGRIVAVDNVSFQVRPGEFVSLVGPSGCGKSTILQCIGGLDAPQVGEVVCAGQKITGPSREIGYMTQQDNLFPWLTVHGNVEFPLRVRKLSKQERAARATEWIERVGLKGFENNFPHELSGGMAKRTALARALVTGPKTILMDEPFGNVDALLRLQLQSQLLRLWEEERRSVLFVTHDLEEAIALSDRVVVLKPRPGRLSTIVDITLARPRNVSTSRFDPTFREVHEQLYAATGYLKIGDDTEGGAEL